MSVLRWNRVVLWLTMIAALLMCFFCLWMAKTVHAQVEVNSAFLLKSYVPRVQAEQYKHTDQLWPPGFHGWPKGKEHADKSDGYVEMVDGTFRHVYSGQWIVYRPEVGGPMPIDVLPDGEFIRRFVSYEEITANVGKEQKK